MVFSTFEETMLLLFALKVRTLIFSQILLFKLKSGPFGATHGNYDFGRSKNAMFDEKTRFVRCKNTFLRYKSCSLQV